MKTLTSEKAVGKRFPVGGDSFVYLGGVDGFSTIDYTGVAGVPGPPLHVHHTIDEAWYILEGKVEFQVGDERVTKSTGSLTMIPRGTAHTFKVLADARWLGIFSPGEGWNLVRKLGEILPPDGPPDQDAVLSLFASYETDIIGPPL